ncbi:hypothetical protein [Phyllobacterium ifriqiyense]|uniref:hypothetical protein n=1 Tax=Phyllobacterium ifriqiyense TaxID=314238 RepID=UPI003390828A
MHLTAPSKVAWLSKATFNKYTLAHSTSSGAGAKVIVASTDVIVSAGSGRDMNMVIALYEALSEPD